MSRILLVIEWLLLLLALLVFALTEEYQPYILAGLVFLSSAFVLRIIRTRRFIPGTGLEIPILLIIISAGIATWVAFDQHLAFLKFCRILGAVVLFYAIVDSTFHGRINDRDYWPPRWIAFGFILAAAVLAFYWPAQHNFTLEPVKFQLLNKVGLAVNNIIPILPGPTIHSNTGGGLLAVAVPFGAVLGLEFWRLRKHFQASLAVLFTLVTLGGMLLTSSRGAFLGLAASFGFYVLAWAQRRWFQKRPAIFVFWSAVALAGLGTLAILIATGHINDLLGRLPDPTGMLLERPQVWARGTSLIQDYFFTGIGLMSFYWNYSVYAIFSQVGVLQHIHNLPIEIWIEQGVLGAIGAIWGVLVIGRWALQALETPAGDLENKPSDDKKSLLGWAGLGGVIVILVHGMVDVIFYVERTLPIMALPAGFAFLATPVITNKIFSRREKFFQIWMPALIAAGLVLLGLSLFQSQVRGAFFANLGAIAQSKAEIPVFRLSPFQKVTIDQVRKDVDLDAALSQFNRSLESNPKQISALQRLTSIALSRGDYEKALAYMNTAWADGHREINTRILYGDALMANGQLEKAAEVLKGIDAIEDHLLYQSWYRYYTTGDIIRAVYAFKTVLLINPNNQHAIDSLKDPRYAPGLNP